MFLLLLLAVLMLGSIAFYSACAFYTHQFFSSPAPEAGPLSEPVSILVPVCGLDTAAWENWSSLCYQNYPTYEVLFGVVDPQDAAVPTLKRLKQELGDRVRLLIGVKPRGLNHKDSILSELLEAARYNLFIFADSDICVAPNYIQQVTAPLQDERVGLVTCAYLGYHPRSIDAALASMGRAFDFIPSLLLSRHMDGGLRGAIGVTMATRRCALQEFGGLHLNRIGSDYNLGKRAAIAGYRVELSHLVLESDTGREGLLSLFRRELRWARTIRFNRGWQYYGMVFCYGTVYGMGLLLVSGFAPWAIALTFLTAAVRYAQVMITIRRLHCPGLIRWLWSVPLRDGLSCVIWVMGAFGSTVTWRGRRLRIIGDGVLVEP